MRTENMITQVKFRGYLDSFSQLLLNEMHGVEKKNLYFDTFFYLKHTLLTVQNNTCILILRLKGSKRSKVQYAGLSKSTYFPENGNQGRHTYLEVPKV